MSPASTVIPKRSAPLGRRVWKEMIRDTAQTICTTHDQNSGCRNEVTRTVWDGANILYDIRMAADTAGTASEGYPSAGTWVGSVGYTHAGGIDTPLDLFKGNTVVAPFADWRGTYDVGTCPTTRCLDNQAFFPLQDATAFGEGQQLLNGPPNWFGELIGGQTDGSGYKYMRNRYYDARSGRFTQEDPIGLAGGLSAYGFAAGNPVSFSDPFGLCKRDAQGREDPDCLRVMGLLRQAAGSADAEKGKGGGDVFRAAAHVFAKTRREVEFVPASHWKENTDKDPSTNVMGETVGREGPILLRSGMGEGDLVLTATHEANVHAENKDASASGTHGGDLDSRSADQAARNSLPQRLTATVFLWLTKL